MPQKPSRERKQERKQEQKQEQKQNDAIILASIPTLLLQLTREPGTYHPGTTQRPFTGIPGLVRVND